MSKNSNLTSTLLNTEDKLIKDEVFKDIVRYKLIAAILIKLCITEYKDMSYIDIAKLIIDVSRDHGELSDDEILQDEIDLQPSETGTGAEKNTINDTVFLMRSTQSGNKDCNKITINFEMQNETNTEYSIISRAIYYGASLLRDTVPAGDTKYTNIHKVYSIWFCSKNLKIQIYDEIQGMYIHKYKFRRCYDNINKVAVDEEADLIETIMVELPKLYEASYNNSELQMINSLFFDTSASINKIESVTKINLTKFRKKVSKLINAEELAQKYHEEGLKKGMQRGMQKGIQKVTINFISNQIKIGKSKIDIINEAVNILGIDKELAVDLYDKIANKIG